MSNCKVLAMLDLVLLIVGVYYYCIWCLYQICTSVSLLLTKPEPEEPEEELTPRLVSFVMMVVELHERNRKQDMENLRLAMHVEHSPAEQHLWKMQQKINRMTAKWDRIKRCVRVTVTLVFVYTCSVAWVLTFVGLTSPVVPYVM